MTDMSVINDFFVRIFNRILVLEQKSISSHARDLSISEMHVIAATARLAPMNKSTVTNLARTLAITPAALSLSVSKLVKKGYLTRKSCEEDRRRVFVFLTEKGRRISEHHAVFHRRMMAGIACSLDESELAMLSRSLSKLGEFFEHTQNI